MIDPLVPATPTSPHLGVEGHNGESVGVVDAGEGGAQLLHTVEHLFKPLCCQQAGQTQHAVGTSVLLVEHGADILFL